MDEQVLLKAIWTGTFTLFGVPLRCSVLEDGQRVIDADDVLAFFSAMGDRTESPSDPAEVERFARWRAGLPSSPDEGRRE